MSATETKTTMTYEEWKAEGVRLFGEDNTKWRFVCPSCGHEQSVQDYKDAGAPLTAAGFSCVGRWLDTSRDFLNGGDASGPCNYAGGGLFKLNPITVQFPYTEDLQAFAFAKPRRCSHTYKNQRGAQCCRTVGHPPATEPDGGHRYRCGGPDCPGRALPASVRRHPTGCGCKGAAGDFAA